MPHDIPVDNATIDLYLDRVMQSYPYGIAKRFLQASPPATEQLQVPHVVQPRLVAFILLTEREDLAQPEEELLGSIIEKGLKMPRSQVAVIVCSAARTSLEDPQQLVQEAITKACQEHAPKLIVAMVGGEGIGSQSRDGSSTGATTILRTHQLQAVAAAPEVKREFWGHLQGGMRVL